MRGVSCSEPNCTVSPTATSKEMIRPVILSSPSKVALGLAILSARAGAATKPAARMMAAVVDRSIRGLGTLFQWPRGDHRTLNTRKAAEEWRGSPALLRHLGPPTRPLLSVSPDGRVAAA